MAMKGQWKTIEAVMAGMIVMMFVATLYLTHATAAEPPTDRAYQALQELYENGNLRSYASSYDAASIDADISAGGYLFGYNHTVSLCNASACTVQPPDAANVWVSRFLLSGQDQYEPMEVVLYVFR